MAAGERTIEDLEKQLGVKDNMIKSMRDRVAEANAAAEKAQADFHQRTVTLEQEYQAKKRDLAEQLKVKMQELI